MQASSICLTFPLPCLMVLLGLGCPCFKASSLVILMMMTTTTTMTRTIAITSSRLSRTGSAHLSKKQLTASPLLQPKFLLPVGQPLSCWMRIDRYPQHPSTVRMGMVLRFMTTIATPGCLFRQECQGLRAIRLRMPHLPSQQSFLHQLATHKIFKFQNLRLLNHSHRHLRRRLSLRRRGKSLSLHRFKRHVPSRHHLTWGMVHGDQNLRILCLPQSPRHYSTRPSARRNPHLRVQTLL